MLAAPWRQILTDRVLPASLFGYLLLAQGLAAVQTWQGGAASEAPLLAWTLLQRASSFILMTLVAALLIIRAPRLGGRAGYVQTLVAIAGTWIMALQVLEPGQRPTIDLLIPSAVLLVGGNVLAIASLAHLGSAFGILPEARGLVTSGPYRLVRHPVYLGEIIAALGAVLPILSPTLACLLLAFMALQYWRALNEERVLSAAFPAYSDYAASTWRAIPGVY